MKNDILVIANGAINKELLRVQATVYDQVICADGGAQFALENHIMPDYIIGDMDSLEEPFVKMAEEANYHFEIHPKIKDATDLELAIKKALNLHPTSITIIGGFGTRWDHSLINLHLLAHLSPSHIPCKMVDEYNTAQAVVEGKKLHIQGRPGDYVSLIPITPVVRGIDTLGLVYKIPADTLHFGSSLPVSNLLQEEKCHVSVQEGILLVLHHYDKLAVNFDF